MASRPAEDNAETRPWAILDHSAERGQPRSMRCRRVDVGALMSVLGRVHLPSLDGATEWLNPEPLDPAGLRGHVVVVDFWTLTCINWLRTEPYVRAWSRAYRNDGLVLIGVHTPEFSFEHDVDRVRQATKERDIDYPVRFHARDAHLVLSAGEREPIPFRVRLDGESPGPSHGVDVDDEGTGVLRDGRLYQLIRQHDGVRERTLEITFLEPGAEAYVFTFG